MTEIRDTRRAISLFMLALVSRLTLMPLGVHWGLIGATILIDVPMQWAADLTFVLTVILVVGNLAVIGTLNARSGTVSARMREGPDGILSYSYLILLAAAASNIGGMMLLVHGETASAGWAIGLSTVVMVCEVSALIGSSYLRADRS